MKIRVKYRKLGRENCWGLAHYDDNLIELDSRLKGRKKLEILLHEAMHLLYPNSSEEEIVKNSIILTKVLWNEQYREIDNNTEQKLQK
jgi:hypothetical protein